MYKHMKTNDKAATKRPNLKPKEFDARYIIAYLDNPAGGKVAALRKAGHPNPERQKAWAMHKRLLSTINAEFDARIMEGASVGYVQTLKLCTDADSESVQAQCAAKLMEYGDKNKPQKIQVEHVDSVEDMDKEIELLTLRIAKSSGQPVDDVQH